MWQYMNEKEIKEKCLGYIINHYHYGGTWELTGKERPGAALFAIKTKNLRELRSETSRNKLLYSKPCRIRFAKYNL